MNNRTILSLCDYTGNWSRPYEKAGYSVIRIDLQHGQDVRLMKRIEEPIHGILAAPPCTHFSIAGSQYWKSKGDNALLEGLAIVDACLRAVAIYHPVWWVLENPKGRLREYLGEPAWRFQPWQFGDPYTKMTCLWGHFVIPVPLFSRQARQEVEPVFSAPGCAGGAGRLPSYRNPQRDDFPGEKQDRTIRNPSWFRSSLF